jgi:uncharacterized protein YciI
VKAVVIGESSGAGRESIMAVYPRHKAVVDRYVAQGSVVGIGPFTDGGEHGYFQDKSGGGSLFERGPVHS